MSLWKKNVVILGFTDKILENDVIKSGANIYRHITKDTDVFVYGKGNNTLITKAKKLKVESLNKRQFVIKYIVKHIIPSYYPYEYIYRNHDYFTYDRHRRPFKVSINKNTFSVYKSLLKQKDTYDKPIIKSMKYLRIFVGKDKSLDKKYDGNSILIKISKNKYIFVGSEVYEFKIDDKDKIIGFLSPVISNSNYPYAVGKTHTYLLLNKQYISNDMIYNDNPYHKFQYNEIKFDIKFEKLKCNIIHKRIYEGI
jgi:hypothetical protein